MPGKTSVSKAKTYEEIGAFWDEHDSTEYGEDTEVEFEVDIKKQVRYFPIDANFIQPLQQLAEKRGITEVTLVNLWIQEKIDQIIRDENPKQTI